MKLLKSHLIICSLLLGSLVSWSQTPMVIDSPPTKVQMNALKDSALTALKEISVLNKAVINMNGKRKADSAGNCGCKPKPIAKIDDAGGWVLTFLPAFLFIGLLIWMIGGKGLKEFNLKEALSESTYPTILVDNPQYTAANLTNATLGIREGLDDIIPPTIEKTYLVAKITGEPPNAVTTFEPPPPNPSISRYIAFITSLLTLVVALGVSCFYLYHYISTGCPPELTGISTLLIALGIGVLPYVFNKVAGAIGRSKDSSSNS